MLFRNLMSFQGQSQRKNTGTGKSGFHISVLWMSVFMVALFNLQSTALAMKIQKVKSPGGIEAWLVEQHNVPLITMEFAFTGGSSQDPENKEGVAYFVSGMLDEGAGKLDSNAFSIRKEELAFRMGFESVLDVFSGSFQTLAQNKDESFEMLRLSLNEPRFDKDAIERIRKQILTSLKFDAHDPNKVAAEAWQSQAFKGHPYGRTTRGTEKTLNAIQAADLKSFVKKTFAKDNLKIAVVGDIDAQSLGVLLDKVFGGLPAKADLIAVPEISPAKGAQEQVIAMDIPQSVVQFGHEGIKRKDPEFIPAYVLNYILGGGGFSSRLMEEVREKRGLAYSVYSYLSPYDKGALLAGGVATENKSVKQSLSVIREVFQKMANEGPTEKELTDAKQYLTGSYALRFDTSPKIASQLLWIQIEDLGIDYIEKRNALVEAVTLDDMKKIARRLLKPEDLIVTIVGKPEEAAVKQ